MAQGKIKKTLKERCPDCGAVLQLRTFFEWEVEKGMDIQVARDYIVCSKDCGFEKAPKLKGKRHKTFLPEVEE